jgi:hypothetical protein
VISEYSRNNEYVKYSLAGLFQALCIIRKPVDITISPPNLLLARIRRSARQPLFYWRFQPLRFGSSTARKGLSVASFALYPCPEFFSFLDISLFSRFSFLFMASTSAKIYKSRSAELDAFRKNSTHPANIR